MAVQASKFTAAGPRRVSLATRHRTSLPLGFLANEEPALGDLMADPLVRRLMASDGVTADAMWSLINKAQTRLR